MTRALLEAKEVNLHNEEGIESFDELVREMISKSQDIKTFAFKTKAMVLTYNTTPDFFHFPTFYYYTLLSVQCVS